MSQNIALSPIEREDDVFELTEIVSDTLDTSRNAAGRKSHASATQAQSDTLDDSNEPNSSIEDLIDTLDPPTSKEDSAANEFDSLLDGLLDETNSPDNYAANTVRTLTIDDTEIKDNETTSAADLDFLDTLIDSPAQEKMPSFLDEEMSTVSVSPLRAAAKNALADRDMEETPSKSPANTLTPQESTAITARLDALEAQVARLSIASISEQVAEHLKASIEKTAAAAAATILREEIQTLMEAMGDEDTPQ